MIALLFAAEYWDRELWSSRFWHLATAARMDLARAELLHYALASSDNAITGGQHDQLCFNLIAEGESA